MKSRLFRQIIFRNAFYDRLRAEAVSRLDRADVLRLVKCDGDGLAVGLIPNVERGEVLTNSRGTGSFQRGVKHENL